MTFVLFKDVRRVSFFNKKINAPKEEAAVFLKKDDLVLQQFKMTDFVIFMLTMAFKEELGGFINSKISKMLLPCQIRTF